MNSTIPDPQVPRLDHRVVAVLQQPDPLHRVAGETGPYLVSDLALDNVQHLAIRHEPERKPTPSRRPPSIQLQAARGPG
jgi:hypothetical protein